MNFELMKEIEKLKTTILEETFNEIKYNPKIQN